ncbi:arginine/serine-rich coiled-coil protein 2-like isoform X3 [Macrobrachium nipponense]|uniref:arginine/serine-rich coiled-coil protein 2-like isoform X3 n=1 Tax=Macrobrachium nipponense TaxID=159736 RepID=UPI0030C8A255
MSSDSEEENGMRHDGDESDERQSRSPSRSRSRSPSRTQFQSRSRSRSESPARMEEDHDDMSNVRESSLNREDMSDSKENGTRRESIDENEVRRQASRSKSPEDNEAWRGAAEKRASRSRSKSKPKEKEPSKESDRKSSGKKKSRAKRSRSRSRSRRRSHSRSRRSRSRNRRRSRSRSRSRGSRSRRRSRSRSRRRTRSRSRSGTPVDGARLHVAELDVDTRKRDLERVFEKYGRLREIWMARNPPCFAFVVYAHQRDADKALKETDGIMIGHCRIKVTQARPRVRGGRMRGGYDPNLRCYQCGELGHFSRNCTDTKFGYKRPPTPPGGVRYGWFCSNGVKLESCRLL